MEIDPETREETMTSDTRSRESRRSLWRHRGRRFATGLNVLVSVGLAAAVVVMCNYLASRYYVRWDLGGRGSYRLSEKTRGLLSSLDAEVTITAFFEKSHALRDDVLKLLKEYEYEADKIASLKLRIAIVDPDRDLSRTRELASRYDVESPNLLVIESGGKRRYVEAAALAEYDLLMTPERKVRKKRTAFTGEQAISSAIHSVTRLRKTRVYFLAGHGEREVEDHGRHSGYSGIARVLRRENVEVATLRLAGTGRVPEDCSALVIAGPDRRLSQAEVEMISAYLERNGRVLFLVDPAIETGLDELLARWGVALGDDVVVGLTLTGRELVVKEYGDHRITAGLRNVMTMFYMPRAVEPITELAGAATAPADKPRVQVLAASSRDGWFEADLDQTPPRFDVDVDRPGPAPVAVAVEKGPVGGIEVEIRPTRMVVIGDSDFVSNGALRSGVGGNRDFFLGALNWLLERDELMAVAPRIPGELRLDMTPMQMKTARLLIVVGMPGLAALLGLVMWRKRRY